MRKRRTYSELMEARQNLSHCLVREKKEKTETLPEVFHKRLNMSNERFLLKESVMEDLAMNPAQNFCPLGVSLLSRFGPKLERHELSTEEKLQKKEAIRMARKFKNKEQVKEIAKEYGISGKPTGKPNPFLDHFEYCLDCRKRVQPGIAESEIERRKELIETLADRCRITTRIFDSSEIEFLETLKRHESGGIVSRWPRLGYRLLKFFECKSKEELIYVYDHWKQWYEKQYGILWNSSTELDTNELRRAAQKIQEQDPFEL